MEHLIDVDEQYCPIICLEVLRKTKNNFSYDILLPSRELDSEPLSSLPRPDRLWGPPSLLCIEYKVLFPWKVKGRGVRLTTHQHLASRLKNAWRYTSTLRVRLHGVVL